MYKADDKTTNISVKQAYILFLLAGFSPMIRLSLVLGAKLGKNGIWLSVIISCAVYYGLILLYAGYFRGKNNSCLFSLFRSAFGKVPSKIIIIFYSAWVFVLAGFYLRAFAERFAGAVMPGINADFFIISLLALVFIILSGKLQSFILMSEIFFYIVLITTATLFLLQLPKINLENLLPVTHYDSENILKGTLPTLSVFAYVTPLLLLGSDVKPDKGETLAHDFKKYGFISACVLLAVNLAVTLMTVGVFGHELVAKSHQPFLMSVKTVGIMGSLERLESIFLLLWVVTDLTIIVMFMYVLMRVIEIVVNLSPISGSSVIKTPLLCGLFVLSLLLSEKAGGANRLMELSEKYAFGFNLSLGFGIPIIAIAIAKLRKRTLK